MRTLAAVLTALLSCGCTSTGPTADAGDPMTLDRLLSGPPLVGAAPSRPAWSPDSRHLAFRWRDHDDARSELWLVDATGDHRRRLTDARQGRGAVGAFAWLPDARGLVYLRSRTLWRVDLDGSSRQLASFDGGAADLQVSPDGRYASVLQRGDLWLVDLVSGATLQATEVAVPSISAVPVGRYRRRDVEIGSYVWGGPTYAWSPDGRTIAVHHVDRRAVRKVPFPYYLADETDPNFVRRGYPGDANERRTVGLLDVATRRLELLDLPEPEARRVVDFSWSRNGELLIDRDADTAVDRWLHVLDPGTGALRELWHDHRDTRVYTSAASAWHPDGEHVLLLADLADRYGLYALHVDRPEPRLLSAPGFDVTDGPWVTDTGAIVYVTNEPSPYERHVFRTTLDATAPQRLTSRPGEARPYPSPDGTRVAVLHGADDAPTDLFLFGPDGRERRITDSTTAEFRRRERAVVRYVTFPSLVDDAVLHARILEPRGLDRSRRHPVIFGPVYSNTVRNRWGGFYAQLQQLMVERGYLVVQVDVRGSTGYGRAFREDFLADFAGRDLDDLESAVAYLEGLGHVDPDRIGIWGSSYGGTLTAYALLKKPGLFDAGVACAAAVDPRFFGSDDVAIVRRPDTHPEAFARGAAQYAAALEDPLLLIHGMQDQVVPFKTIIVLAEELMKAGKNFDMAFAPGGTHGWTGRRHHARYLLGKLLAHFDRHLAGR